jgi:hypothetical protein
MYQVYIQYFTFGFVLNSLPIPQIRLRRLTSLPPHPPSLADKVTRVLNIININLSEY